MPSVEMAHTSILYGHFQGKPGLASCPLDF